MPQLPSGKHVGLTTRPLHQLLVNLDEGSNFALINKIGSLDDLFPYVEIIYFINGNTDTPPKNLHEITGKLPAGLTEISSGYRLSQKAELFSDWPLADCQALNDFIAGDEFQKHLGSLFNDIKHIRVKCLIALIRHYGKLEGFIDDDDELDNPEIDTYDLLAALGCINATNYSNTSLTSKSPHAFERLSGMWSVFSAKLGLEDYEFNSERHPRTIAEQIRKNAPLDQLTPTDKSWFEQQTVVEAIELWEHADEDLFNEFYPTSYTILQLAVAAHGG